MYQIIQCYNPENHTMMTLCCENFKFYILNTAASQEIIDNTVEKVWFQAVKVVLSSGYIKCQKNTFVFNKWKNR